MCGIVAIVRRPSARPAPTADELLKLISDAGQALDVDDVLSLNQTQVKLDELNALLAGVPGATSMMTSPGLVDEMRRLLMPLMDELSSTDSDAVHQGIIDEDLNAARRSAKDTLLSLIHI